MFEFLRSSRSSRRSRRRVCELESLEIRSLLSAVVPGLTIDGQAPIVLPEIDGQELLAVSDGATTTKFYTTDGTIEGTVQYAELPVVINGPLQQYAVNNGELFFAATDPVRIGNELWKTDGTAAGTTLVKDINTRQVSFLVNGTEDSPAELWVNRNASETSGFESKVVFEKGITTQWHTVSLPVGDYAYWSRPYVNGEAQVWSSRRTEYVRVQSSDPSDFTVLGNDVFFVADDANHGRELWKTNGTDASTVLINDLVVDTYDNGPPISDLVAFDSRLYFIADTASNYGRDYQLFQTDGTVDTPTRLTQERLLTPISVINNQLVMYGLQDDNTLGLATIDNADDITPDFFYTFPLMGEDGGRNRLDGFFVDGDKLYFSQRIAVRQFQVSFGTGKDRYSETHTEENTSFVVADVSARTVIEISESISNRELASYQFTYQQFADAVSVGGVSLFAGADDILRQTDGNTVTTIADRVVHGPVLADGNAYFVASAIDGDGFPDIYKLDGTSGTATALNVPFRDTQQLSELADALQLQAPTETGSTLLELDETAQPASAPEVTSPLSEQVVSRGAVSFRWNAVPNADFYELRVSRVGSSGAPQRFDQITGTSFDVEADSGNYTFVLRARFVDGSVGQWTPRTQFTVGLEPAPEIIGPTVATPQSEGDILLRWRRQPVVDVYEVKIVRLNADGEVVAAEFQSDQPFVFRELTAGDYRMEVNGAFYYEYSDSNIAERSEVSTQVFTVANGPTGPVISSPASVQPGSNTLAWQPVANAISYDVFLWDLDNPDANQWLIETPIDVIDSFDFTYRTIKLAEVTETSQQLFLVGGQYGVAIRAHLPDGRLTTTTRQTISVAAGQNLTFLEIDQNGQHGPYRWSEVPGAVGYQVWISEEGSSAYKAGSFLQQGTAVGGVIESLPVGNYHMFVRARMSGVTGEDPSTFVYLPWVNSQVFTIQPVVRYSVSTRSTASLQKTLRPSIQWYDYQADSYEVVLNDAATGQEVYRKTGITTFTHTVEKSLSNGSTYEVWIRAHFADGSSTRWGTQPSQLVTTLATIDGRPTVTISDRLLTWTLLPEVLKHRELGGGHSIWIQKIAEDGTRTSEVIISNAVVGRPYGPTTAVDRAIMNLPAGNYAVRVRGEVDSTRGAYSDEVFFTINDSPAQLTTLTYDGETLRWTALSSSKYNLQGTYQLVIDEIDSDGNIVEAGVYDGLVGNIEFAAPLPPGRFQARVRAYYQQGGAEFSNTVVMDRTAVPVTFPVLITAPTESKDGRPLFEWSSVEQAVRYEIDITDEAGTAVVFDNNITGTNFQTQAPLPGGKLTFRVRAVTPQQTTAWSTPHQFEVFNAPVDFTNGLSPGFDQTVDFAWEDRGVDVTYELYIQQPGISGAVYYRRGLTTTSHELQTPLDFGNYVAWIRAWYPDGSRSRWGTGNAFSIAGRPAFSITGNVVTWPVFTGATRYELWVDELDASGTKIGSKVYYNNQLTAIQTTLTGLSSGHYAAWLRAIKLDGGGETRSLWSSRTRFDIA